jgi:hypothetical protein
MWVLKLRLEKLYYCLKSLVNDNTEIHIRDNVRKFSKPCAEVALVSSSNSYHWTHFQADTIENALRKAIAKLRHPEKNYVDDDGHVWKANESSVYSANHVRSFLRPKTEGD